MKQGVEPIHRQAEGVKYVTVDPRHVIKHRRMSELVVLAFDNTEAALQARDRLLDIQKRRMLQLADAAVVVRQKDGKLKVKQSTSLVGSGAVGGVFWGLLIGLLFAVPWMGLTIGALTDRGVDDRFIKKVAETIQPGHSALFLLVHMGDLETWLPSKRLQTLKSKALR